MPIDYLADRPEFLDELAARYHAEWGYLHPEGRGLEQVRRELVDTCGRGGVPSAVVAHADGELVGGATLVHSDMDDRPELTPWLASVLVKPVFRRRGYAGRLVARIEAVAAAAGIDRLYLFTDRQAAFYARRGWRAVEDTTYKNERITIMSKPLS